jgi:hypothetical protein
MVNIRIVLKHFFWKMLPAAHVQRVRVQSIPAANADFEQLTTESEQEQQRGNIRNEQHEKRKTLAEVIILTKGRE